MASHACRSSRKRPGAIGDDERGWNPPAHRASIGQIDERHALFLAPAHFLDVQRCLRIVGEDLPDLIRGEMRDRGGLRRRAPGVDHIRIRYFP